MYSLILASKSPRRQELLKMITTDFVVRVPVFDEGPIMSAGLSPEETVRRLSAGKAAAALDAFSREGELFISGDTVVVSPDGEIMGKPKDRADAARMLRALSGRTHQVITGITLAAPGRMETFSVTTSVTFYHLSQQEIEDYLDTGEPFDKAGGYGIQGLGGLLVKEIRGDYYNVVGLPVAALSRAWKRFLLSMGK